MGATGLLSDKNRKAMPALPKTGTQVVDFDASATGNRTTAIPGSVCFVRATADCWIKRGTTDVTATVTPGADVFFVGANDGWWDYNLPAGGNYLAVIGATAAGKLYVLETS